MEQKKRLLSIDVLRGITIAFMLLVNNPGSWNYVYAPLEHAQWHGMTPTDLIFPFFMFIMGVSEYLSLRKYDFKPTVEVFFKIIKRTLLLFAIGVLLNYISLSWRTFLELDPNMDLFSKLASGLTNFSQLRITGVFGRLALSYGISATIAVLVKHKYIPHIIAGVFLIYFILLSAFNGFEFSENNIISIVDRTLIGASHLYKDNGVVLDPEGLFSTLPCVCHVLIGFLLGKVILKYKDNSEKMLKLFIWGTILSFSGFLFSYACPVNKKIWSPTFSLISCGLCAITLALLIWIIDVKNHKRWCKFFESFGVNALFTFILGTLLTIVFMRVKFSVGDTSYNITSFLYKTLFAPIFGNYLGSLMYAIVFVLVIWVVGNILYRKKIYIKI